MAFAVLIVSFGCICAAFAAPACDHVRLLPHAGNVTLPDKPTQGGNLSICKNENSCCSSDIELYLLNLVKKDYQTLLQHNAQSVQGILASTAIHFQDYVHQMMLKAENKTLDIFDNLFGSISSLADSTVKTFYEELKSNLNDSRHALDSSSNLAAVTSRFFIRLFPFMYQATMNQNARHLDPDFEMCLQTRMQDIKPFSDITKMLERDIAKTLEATKILVESLKFGAQVLNSTNVLALSESSLIIEQCYQAQVRMVYCAKCYGYATSKPCSGYCLNVIRGCLAQQAEEFDTSWSNFYEAVGKLISFVNQGQSLVCLEDLLRSLHSRIAEPVMYFMDHTANIHSKAKYVCGQVKWVTNGTEESGERQEKLGMIPGVVLSTKVSGEHADWSTNEKDDLDFRSSLLNNKIIQFRDSIPRSRGFYANLADTMCSDDDLVEIKETRTCWNGQLVAEYSKTVLPIQYSSQKYNPEFLWPVRITSNLTITHLMDKLRHMTQLISSQVMTNPESDSQFQLAPEEGSGSGGGVAPIFEPYDDEVEESGSGSGGGALVTDPPEVPRVIKPEVKSLPSPPADNHTEIKTGAGSRMSTNVVLIMTTIYVLSLYK